MRSAIISSLIVLLFAVSVFAIDPGVPDTIVYQERVYAPLNQGNWSTAMVDVYFITDDSVSDVTVPTTWRSTDNQIYADSIIWGSFMMQWDDYWSSINRDTSIIHILGFSDLGGADNPPLYTNFDRLAAFTIRFRISPTAAPQIVTLDTTRDRRMGSANFGPFNGGNSYTPIIIPGSLYYGISTGIESSDNPVPTGYLLEQNYPNPFNPITQISFVVPVAGEINVEVYNLLGQKIRTLLSEYKETGRYSVAWNGMNESGQQVPSGVYFYRLTTKDHSETKRMMLLK
jgi:hypothetical protein